MLGLVIGVFKEGSTNVSQAKALTRLGVEVHPYEYRGIAKAMGRQGRDADLIGYIQKLKPRFVLISKGNTISSRVMDLCQNTRWILWYMDPMGNFNPELVDKIKRAYWSYFALQRPCQEAIKVSRQCSFLPEGYDADTDWIDGAADAPSRSVTFIGSLDKKRRAYIKRFDIDCVRAYGPEHAEVVRDSAINLNFVRGNDGCSDRVYKVLAAGGFLLTEPWPGMHRMFKAGEHLDTFSTPDELGEKVRQYINDPAARKRIAAQGQQAVKRFSRDAWAKTILSKVLE